VSGSDILLAGLSANGDVILQDRFARGHSTPVVDHQEGGSEDWTLVSVSRDGPYLVIAIVLIFVAISDQSVFSSQQIVEGFRPLRAVDKDLDVAINAGPIKIIWALGLVLIRDTVNSVIAI
jgi:hypothetical protein